MNRSFLTLIILILVIACIPWIDGWLFKKNYLEFIDAINNDTDVKINVTSYHLGWLSSDAILNVSAGNEEAPLNIHFTIKDHIKHGPLVFDSNMPKVAFALILGSVYNTQAQKILDIETRATFTRNFISKINIHGLEQPLVFGKLTWGGLDGNSECNLRNNHLNQCKWNFAIEPFTIQSPFGSFDVPKSIYKSEMTLDSRGFWSGSQTFTVPLTMLEILGYDVRSADLKVSQNFGAKDNTYFMTTEVAAQEIMTPDMSIAPLNLKIALTGLNLDALLAITKENNAAAIRQIAPQIVTKDTLLTEDLNIGTNHGKFILTGHAQLSPKVLPIKDANTIGNGINYEFHVRADVNLVDYLIELTDAHTIAAEQPTESPFQKQIAFLQEQKLVSLYAASQLKDLANKPIPYDEYLTLIERLASTKEISNTALQTLKSLYSLTQPSNAPAPQNPSQSQWRGQLDTYIKQGYVLKNGTEYNTSIVYQDGILKINGLVVKNPPKLSDYTPVAR